MMMRKESDYKAPSTWAEKDMTLHPDSPTARHGKAAAAKRGQRWKLSSAVRSRRREQFVGVRRLIHMQSGAGIPAVGQYVSAMS
jgi:hypothetical protein